MNSLCAFFFFICFSNILPGFESIGINYGLNGNDLPPPGDVIPLLQSRGISKIRIFEPNHDVLTALKGCGISVIIGTRNEDLQSLASDVSAATAWVQAHIIPFASSLHITSISAGNEVIPGPLAQYVLGAIQNLDSAVAAANLAIPVTTTVSMAILSSSYPPSAGVFAPDASTTLTLLATYLQSKESPLLVNVYTYFPRESSPNNVPLDYALMLDTAKPVIDGAYTYLNLFDAMLDAVYAALEKAGAPNVVVIVGETGWPSGGGAEATVENAQTYNNNVVKHVSSGKGTPRRPARTIDTYIFALFNENMKAEGVEQHWGLYYPNKVEVYHVDF